MRNFILLISLAALAAAHCKDTGCAAGKCCSYWGYCGSTSAYCGTSKYQCVCDCPAKGKCVGGSTGSTTTTTTPTPTTTGCTNYKTTASLNIRRGAGTNYGVVRTAPKGTVLCVVSTSGSWSRLSDGNYASSRYLTQSNASSSGTNTNTNTNTGSTTNTGSGSSTSSGATDRIIWDFLKGKGLNNYAVAGLMGNLDAESNLRSNNLQNSYERSLGYSDESYTRAVDNGSYNNFVRDAGGYGLAQWTYWSRKQNLLNYARAQGKSIADLNMQLNFLWDELNSSYRGVVSDLRAATSVRAASNSVLLKFERPADQSASVQSRRASMGQVFYNKFA